MQQSSSKANGFSASQEVSRIFLNPTVPCPIPAICTYICRVKSIESRSTNPTSYDPFYHFPSIYAWTFQTVVVHQVSPTDPLRAIRLSPKCATRPTHLMLLEFIIRMCGDRYISLSSLSCILLQYPVVSFHFNPKRFLSIPFSDNLSRWSSSSARDQNSNPYKTGDNIIVLQINITISQHSIILTVRCVNLLLYLK